MRRSLRKWFVHLGVETLSTAFFVGYIPFASGTVGTLFGCTLWILLPNLWIYGGVLFFVIVTGFFITGYAERVVFNEKDSSKIVIDEVAGILITFFPFRFSRDLKGALFLVVGFLAFRFFDVVKPFPIKRVERWRGSAGIMLDDLLSGVFSNGILLILRFVLSG